MNWLIATLLVIPVLVAASRPDFSSFSSRMASGESHCEPLSLSMCKTLGLYNKTRLPNFFGQTTQEEAGMEVHQFWPLVKINCSPMLGLFLCSLYTPICLDNYDQPLPPCRSVCEASKQGCAPIMATYGFQWPKKLECDQFPAGGDSENLCMEPPESYLRHHRPTAKVIPPLNGKMPPSNFNPQAANEITPSKGSPNAKQGPTKSVPSTGGKDGAGGSIIPTFPNLDNFPGVQLESDLGSCRCSCQAPFRPVPEDYHPHRQMYIGNVSNCANPCHSAYFSKEEQKFGVFWIGLWSSLCCLSTFITVTTFLIDMDRFRYPERSIIFLSFCYFMVSIGFIISLAAGHEKVSCDSNYGVARADSSDSAICTVVFLLVYLFGMASSVWWVILALTWFLSAGLKWSTEAIAKYVQYFHLVAWFIPSVKTVAILAIGAVDGDSVSGICFVGNSNVHMLRWFVLAPLFAYLILGSLFLFAGFISLFRIRNAVKLQGKTRIEKLEQLMVRIGIFSVLYTVPATIVIACYFYEQHYRTVWEKSLTCHGITCLETRYKPEHSIFMLKYLMLLVVGVTSGMWIWSKKTLASWKNFYGKLCRCACLIPEQPIYQPADAIIAVRSATDVSSSYIQQHKQYPLSHV